MSSLLDAYRLLREGTQQTTGDTSMPQNGPDKDVCPKCGKDTHRTPWAFIAEARRKHREEKGIFYNVKEWWSI